MFDNEEMLNLNELEDAILNINEDALTIPEIHGFLTAILICPDFIPPSIWLPKIFNRENEMPEFRSDEEAQYVTNGLLAFYNSINEEIDDYPDPIFPVLGKSKNAKPDPWLWCSGFITGINLDEDAWFGSEDEYFLTLIFPIYYCYDPETFSEISRTASGRKRRGFDKAMLDLIPESIVRIRAYWRSKMPQYSKPQGHVIPFGKKKIGRNDPCPCGSGKKYKNCCGKEKRV